MHGRGRGFLDSFRNREVRSPGRNENPCNLTVVVRDKKEDEMEKAFNDWDPMKEAYHDPKFNSYSGGLGMELSAVRSPPGHVGRVARAPEPGQNNFELYITGIPRDLGDDGLKNLFSRAGSVKKSKVMESRNLHIKGTYGFVGYESPDEVQRAIQMLDNFPIRGHTLRVQLSKTKEEKEADARRQVEAAAAMGHSNNGNSYGQTANSGYESATGRGPRDSRNVNRSNGRDSSSKYGSPRVQQQKMERGAGDAKPHQQIVVSAEPVNPGPCLRCGKIGNFRCKNCKGLYCGLICQKEDWKKHRKTCLRTKKDRESGNDSNKENDNVIRSGPMKGFEISIPGDDELREIPSPRPAVQKKSDSRIMVNDLGRVRLPEGTTVMKLTFFHSPVSFSFIFTEHTAQILELGKALQEQYGAYKENCEEVYVPIKDELVAAFYHVDNSWNRGRVLNVTGTEARIKFVDFGNEEVLPFKLLRKGHEIFKKLKIQGIDVSLAHYIYTKEAMEPAEVETVGQLLVFDTDYKVTDVYGGSSRQDSPFIQLEDMNGRDIGKILADAGIIVSQKSGVLDKSPNRSPVGLQKRDRFNSGGSQSEPQQNGACAKSPTKQNTVHQGTPKQDDARPRSPDKRQLNDSASRQSPSANALSPRQEPSPAATSPAVQVVKGYDPEKPVYSYPTVAKTFNTGREVEVSIVEIEETRFWIQEVAKTGFLEQLTQDMTAYYEQKPLKKDFRPTKTCLVAARFPKEQEGDDRFYRAHIFNFSAEGILDVRYLDYANKAQVTFRDVQNLESNHLIEDFQAVPVHLVELDPSEPWSADAVQQFAQLVSGIQLKATVVTSTNHCAVLDMRLPDNRRLTDVMLEFGVKKAPAAAAAANGATAAPNAHTPPPMPMLEQTEQISLNRCELQDGATGVVIYADDFNRFFFKTEQNFDQKILQELESCRSKCEQCNPDDTGQFVIALSPKYGDLYRGQVMKISQIKQKAQVYYVDFGNLETVPFANIAKMSQKLAEIPMLAIPCSLGMTVLPDKTADLSSFCERQWQVKIDAKEENGYIVDLFNDGQSLRESLAKQGLVQGNQKQDSGPAADTSSRKPALPPAVEPSQYNEPLQVMVTDASQFDSLYLQLIVPETNLQKIQELALLLEAEYPNAPSLDKPPKEGDLVVAKFSEDGNWYRAVVWRVGEVNAFVQFVDYGNTETVLFADIKEMNETAAGYSIQSLVCYLQGVMIAPGVKWDPGNIPLFQPVPAVFLKGDGDKYEIKLFNSEGQDQAEHFKSKGLVVPAAVTPSVPKTTASDIAAVEKPPSELPPMYCPSMNTPLAVVILDAPSCEDIYLQVSEEQVSLYATELWTKLNTPDGKEHPKIAVSVGDFVVARSIAYNEYYRALVKEVMDDGIIVLYVDFGNVEKVTQNDIKPMMPDLLEYPRIALRCCFENVVQVPGAQWSPASVQGVATHVVVKEMKPPDTVMVDLFVDGRSLRDELIAQNVLQPRVAPATTTAPAAVAAPAFAPALAPAPVKPTEPKRLDLMFENVLPAVVPQPNQHCLIIYVNSISDFYVQMNPDDETTELLSTYLRTYSEEKAADSSSRLKAGDISPGLLVSAKFTDGIYYRGVVKEKQADGSGLVFFIDFGNSELTSINDMVPLNKKLASAPPIAIRVSQIDGVAHPDLIPKASLESCVGINLNLKQADRLADGSFKASLVDSETGQAFAISLLSAALLHQQTVKER